MIKVLGLALYSPMAASTRYRLGQYVPGLAGQGIDFNVHHLLGDDYLHWRFGGGKPSISAMLQSGFNRISDLCHQREYDAVMVHCELFPLMPGWMESALIRQPYIYDFDDAFYMRYRRSRFGERFSPLGDKFDTVMQNAAALTPGNKVLDQYARRHNSNTHILPTVVDTARYLPQLKSSNEMFTIGWIGSPSTAIYLKNMIEPLSILGNEGAVRLIVIGGKAPIIPGVSVVEVEWQEHTEVDLINSFDVGVMPLLDDDWARGKCAFKLIQYMACSVPVIASPVGANVDVVTGDSGFLAATSEEWVGALRILRDQPNTRLNMGQAGRARVEQYYSLQGNLPVLANIIRNVVA